MRIPWMGGCNFRDHLSQVCKLSVILREQAVASAVMGKPYLVNNLRVLAVFTLWWKIEQLIVVWLAVEVQHEAFAWLSLSGLMLGWGGSIHAIPKHPDHLLVIILALRTDVACRGCWVLRITSMCSSGRLGWTLPFVCVCVCVCVCVYVFIKGRSFPRIWYGFFWELNLLGDCPLECVFVFQ